MSRIRQKNYTFHTLDTLLSPRPLFVPFRLPPLLPEEGALSRLVVPHI